MPTTLSGTPENGAPGRSDRRRLRTRAALIRAAQTFLADGRTNVSVLELTTAADVGNGSFYNHFESKEVLFRAAVEDVLDAHGDLMDSYTADLDDPAEAFAQSFRLTGRLHRQYPALSRVVLQYRTALLSSHTGLAPRAFRDISAAAEAGRFSVTDPRLALTTVAGATLALGALLHLDPDRDDATATDEVTFQVLLGLGMSASGARELCDKPLPDIPSRSGGPPTGEPELS